MDNEGSRLAQQPQPVNESASDVLDLRVVAPLALTALVGMMNGFAIGPLLPNMSRDLDISVPVQVATFILHCHPRRSDVGRCQ